MPNALCGRVISYDSALTLLSVCSEPSEGEGSTNGAMLGMAVCARTGLPNAHCGNRQRDAGGAIADEACEHRIDAPIACNV